MNEIAKPYYERFLHLAALAQRIRDSLAQDEDWASVVLFYSTVHLMNSYLVAKISYQPSLAVHHDRFVAMRKCPELRESPEEHRKLKDLSESVRYDPGFIFGTHHLASADKQFDKIRRIVEPKVKKLLGLI